MTMRERRGGRREGAGRKAKDGRKVRMTITLAPDLVSTLDKIDRNRSAAIERLLKERIEMMTVYLVEDNAGGLFVGKKDAPWYDVTRVQDDSQFADDANALANDDTGDWTVDRYDEEPLGDVVARCVDGLVMVDGKPGRAASNYLRIPYPA